MALGKLKYLFGFIFVNMQPQRPPLKQIKNNNNQIFKNDLLS